MKWINCFYLCYIVRKTISFNHCGIAWKGWGEGLVLHVHFKHLSDCPGQVKVRFGQVFWKTKNSCLNRASLKCVMDNWTYNFQYKKINLFLFGGQVKMSFGQVFFIRFVLQLPEWESGDKTLCSTLEGDVICGEGGVGMSAWTYFIGP